MSNCRRCNRQLKDPFSVSRGYGKVCWSRISGRAGQAQEDTNIVLVLNDRNAPRDVFFRRLDGGKVETNVVQVMKYHSPSGFEWGYGGSGPADLALNILLRFVPRSVAVRLHQDFKWKFISTAPREGANLSAEEIDRWILEAVR